MIGRSINRFVFNTLFFTTYPSISSSFAVEEITKINPYFSSAYIIVCIAASVKSYKFKSLMKIESYGIRITGLCLKRDDAAVLVLRDFLCLIHKPFAKALALKFSRYPQLSHHQSV
jgi:hypothetical protein